MTEESWNWNQKGRKDNVVKNVFVMKWNSIFSYLDRREQKYLGS